MSTTPFPDRRPDHLPPAGRNHTRREFLKRTVLAAAGTSLLVPPSIKGQTLPPETPGELRDGPDTKAPMSEVEGKVAFITGGSSGIGLGIACAFAEAGMKIGISYRTESHLEEARQQLKSAGDHVHAIRVDVTDRDGMEKAAQETIEAFGKIHVLVNNAGIQLPKTLSATAYEEWDRMMEVNLNGVFNGVHAFLPHIKKHGEGGQVVATSSIMGLFAPGAGYGAYCAAKFAVVGMMESLRAELAGTDIGVSLFCPGMVKSNLEEFLKEVPMASDPLEIGRRVLRGIRRNDLYILTHPEFEQVMRDRSEALVASIPRDVHPSEERLSLGRKIARSSIYAVERQHHAPVARG